MNRQGISIIEVILSIALLSIISLGFIRWLATSQESTVLAGERSRAVYLAQEGLEAARSIRDNDFSGLTTGTHGIEIIGGEWMFSGASDVIGDFTRTVDVSVVDASRKEVVSQVQWNPTPYKTSLVVLTTYLTYWMASSGRPIPITPDAVLNFTGPADGTEVALYHDGGNTYVVMGRVVSPEPEFYVINVTDPSAPTITASLEIGSTVNDVSIVGSYAYIATTDNSAELQVISLSSVASPSIVGFLDFPGNVDALSVVAQSSSLFLSRSNNPTGPELYAISIAIPTVPVTSSALEVGGNVNKLTLDPSFSYLFGATSHNSKEVLVVDVTSFGSISEVGSLDLSGVRDATAILAFSNSLVVARADGYFYTIDATTPTSLSVQGSLTVGLQVNDLAIGEDEEYVFIASASVGNEIAVIDIRSPTTPTSYYAVDLGGNEASSVIWDEDLNRVFGGGKGNNEEFFVLIP